MFSAQLWIERDTGYVTKSDTNFKDWISRDTFEDVHIDNFFDTTEGASIFEQIQERLQHTQFHFIHAVPKFERFRSRQVVCFVDARDNLNEESLTLSIYPHREPTDELDAQLEDPPTQLFDTITDFLLVCAPDYTIKRANRAAKAVYGGVEEIEGRKCYEVLRDKDHPCHDCPLPRTLNTGKMTPSEYFDSNLKEFLELRTYPHIDEEGFFTDFTILSRVVSQRREIEGETAQNKKLQALGQMASGLAHDFNNMLTIILGRVQLLKSRLNEPFVLSNLKTIEKAAFDSTDIIQRLQDFTRKRSQDDPEIYDRIPVNSVIEDVVNYAQTRIDRLRKQQGLRIEIETQLRDIPSIEGNKAQLRSALLNVVFNAIDAMEIGGVVTIWTEQVGTQVEIGISDTGIGMTKEVREKIFDPFFTTKGEEGNGLGLSEVYGIVNQHNGNIKVESTPGEGTTMLLYFPAGVS
ncbi:MAG: PAS domain-containing protein [Candidatus Marinimicrobia bacterium]|nr:PAS domain-containing protein [Candidatus Neomarinimicrobiota bacterium]MCF7829916.1 PAS domain-containing protein [Candidatus Neomarinimicrobiota bacterium]MCF7879121.1 PAS domain-containing protein [Candidatus Neomarinimicrobiota bacterium]